MKRLRKLRAANLCPLSRLLPWTPAAKNTCSPQKSSNCRERVPVNVTKSHNAEFGHLATNLRLATSVPSDCCLKRVLAAHVQDHKVKAEFMVRNTKIHNFFPCEHFQKTAGRKFMATIQAKIQEKLLLAANNFHLSDVSISFAANHLCASDWPKD